MLVDRTGSSDHYSIFLRPTSSSVLARARAARRARQKRRQPTSRRRLRLRHAAMPPYHVRLPFQTDSEQLAYRRPTTRTATPNSSKKRQQKQNQLVRPSGHRSSTVIRLFFAMWLSIARTSSLISHRSSVQARHRLDNADPAKDVQKCIRYQSTIRSPINDHRLAYIRSK